VLYQARVNFGQIEGSDLLARDTREHPDELERLKVSLDGRRLLPADRQHVAASGTGRNLAAAAA
jgi:hypothetical protein